MRQVSTASQIIRLCSLGLATSWSVTAANAVCGTPAVGGGGSGPPSISVTEASTTQVLEQIRKRGVATQEQLLTVADASTAAPPPPPAASQAAAQASSASSSAATSGASGTSTTKAQPAKKAASASPQTYSSGGGSLKDDYGVAEVPGTSRTTAVWAQGFFDYEKHDNLAPGNQENPDRKSYTGGGVIGADWTVPRGSGAIQYGLFSGYSHTKSDFSDTIFRTDESGDGTLDTDYARTNSEQEIDGPFIGAYISSVSGPWMSSLAFKADFFDLSASSTLTQTCGNFANGNDGVLSDIGQQSGSADVTTFTVAATTEYRHDLTAHSWIAPMAGIRYSHTDFSNDRSNAVFTDIRLDPNDPGTPGTATPGTLGLDDGYSIRLQAGLRYGEEHRTSQGYIWTTTIGAFLYSDVLVEGFVGIAGQTGEIVSPVDEGEVRVLGQITSNVDMGNGLSYQFLGEIRGGDDLFGIGGLIGARYEW